MRRLLAVAPGLWIALSLAASAPARADALDDVAKELVKLDAEAQNLALGVKKPTTTTRKDDVLARRLLDAQVEFGVGNFEGAALLLYDYINQATRGRDHDTALYYLAESLFQKGDYIAAQGFFVELVDQYARSKFYQQGLERLLEVAVKLQDSSTVARWLAALDRVPSEARRASVPYVRGKYSFSLGAWDDAEASFRAVPPDSEYGFQAQYFVGTTQTARGDVGAATKTFAELTRREPRTDDEQRVLELAQLALGRLYYERDQPTKAVDAYLLIDRKSPLFDEALLEVAWVYVKAQQFDKALRSLELLALADPNSSKLPTVRLLEGNLRIRKAQKLRAAQLGGTEAGEGNPAEEYLKADQVFTATRALYEAPHAELAAILERRQDPREFLTQVTGRVSATFDVRSTMPEIAAAWVRETPDVAQVVAIEGDLGDIQANIAEAEATIERLEAALGAGNGVNVFPSLASKRDQGADVAGRVLGLRARLARTAREVARKYATPAELAELDRLEAERQKAAAAHDALPGAGRDGARRVDQARGQFEDVDRAASEIQLVVDTTESTMIALRKYLDEASPKPSAAQRAELDASLGALAVELAELRAELAELRREATLGRDVAGADDAAAARATALRDALAAAFAAERAAAAAILARATGADRTRGQRIATLSAQADAVTERLDGMRATIDAIVDEALADVRGSMAREKADLAAYRQEFQLYEAESRELGGTVLGSAFRDVKTAFYDVLVRSDVGSIDITWSQKEESDSDLQRLEVDRARELKQIIGDFRDVVAEERQEREGGSP